MRNSMSCQKVKKETDMDKWQVLATVIISLFGFVAMMFCEEEQETKDGNKKYVTHKQTERI